MKIKVILYDRNRRPEMMKAVEVNSDNWQERYLAMISWCKKRGCGLSVNQQRWFLDGRRFRALGQCQRCGKIHSTLDWQIGPLCSAACSGDSSEPEDLHSK